MRKYNVVMIGSSLAGQSCNLEWISKYYSCASPRVGSLAGYDCFHVEVEAGRIVGRTDCPATILWWKTTESQVYPGKTGAVCSKADAFVFVADSQRVVIQRALDALGELMSSLHVDAAGLSKRVGVVQYTKRDLPNVMSVDELSKHLNPMRWPEVQSSPALGQGVKGVVEEVVRKLCERN